MKLKNILKQHLDSSSAKCLKGNLGDGYLLKNNEVFRDIRLAALNFGFDFTEQVDPFYASLPLSQLDVILENRKIPFHNNVDVLLEIESRNPGQMEWDFICDGLKQNHVFHESCHAVASGLRRKLAREVQFESNRPMNLLLTLLDESFANTCEFLAVGECTDSTHQLFFEWNSYICIFEQKSNIKKACKDIGRTEMIKFFILAYLYCNFLHERWQETDFQRVLQLCFNGPVSDQVKKTLRVLSKEVFTLNPRFRYATTSFYLRSNGYSENIGQALNFDPIKIIENHNGLQNWIDQLSHFEKSI